MKSFLKQGALLGSATALMLVAGAGIALAQTATTPKTTSDPAGCSTGSGADMTQCQNNLSNQQNDATVGNGPNATDPAKSNGIGGNNTGPDSQMGTAGGNGQNPASGTTGQNSGGTNANGSGAANGGNSGNQGGSSSN